jgi:hypothetical protein
VVGQFGAAEVLQSLSVPLALCGVASACVITWYHGERGKQRRSSLEWILLGVITAIWLASSAWILIA